MQTSVVEYFGCVSSLLGKNDFGWNFFERWLAATVSLIHLVAIYLKPSTWKLIALALQASMKFGEGFGSFHQTQLSFFKKISNTGHSYDQGLSSVKVTLHAPLKAHVSVGRFILFPCLIEREHWDTTAARHACYKSSRGHSTHNTSHSLNL